MERKAASMERFASGASLQKQRCYCNKIISQYKKTYKKIVWIITVSLRRRHRQSQKWLGLGRLVFSREYGYTLLRALDEVAVMNKKALLIILISLLLVSCGLRWEGQVPGPRDEGSPPQILASYAEQVVRPGETWKVYLRVKDVDCDMTYVITDLWQSGGGSYPVSFTPIKGLPCPELEGYVFLKTPADGDLLWDQFQAKLFVRDRRGNRSNSLQLPLNFDQVLAKKPPEEWRSDTVVSIGAINIDLINRQEMDSGG